MGKECTSLRNQTESTRNTKEKKEWDQVFSTVLSVARAARADPKEINQRIEERVETSFFRRAICSTRSKSRF